MSNILWTSFYYRCFLFTSVDNFQGKLIETDYESFLRNFFDFEKT